MDEQGIILEIADAAQQMRLRPQACAREFDTGQFEITLYHGLALDAADRDTLFRHLVKEVAARHELSATFMGRPFTDRGGSGCHVHLSLQNENKTNIFSSKKDEKQPLSLESQYFLAGVLAHAPALMALLCPTVNAYKRLRPQSFVPLRTDWDFDNRSVFVRVPREMGEATRLEIRAADGAVNPYLALAAILWAGLDGLRQQQLPPPALSASPESLFQPLPRSLEESLDHLERDAWLYEKMGPLLMKVFCDLKRQEIEYFRTIVSREEREFYRLL